MIVSGNTDGLSAYVVGPVLGGTAAALLYSRFLALGTEPGEAAATQEAGTA